MKILLLGANGSLGKQFKILFKSKNIEFYAVTRKHFNSKSDYEDLKKIIELFKPNFIINCIALTGLIYCENKPKLANETNYRIPCKITKIIKNKNIDFIHFSSEAVFEGMKFKKIYTERSISKPKSVYGKTKLKADKCVMRLKKGRVIRIPLLFGPTHKEQIVASLLKQIKKKKKIYVADDVYSTPVYTPFLCEFIYKNLIRKNNFQGKKLIHYTSVKLLSLYDLIILLSKKIKGRDLSKIVRVKDEFFKLKLDIKPKNLGLKSIYPKCNKKIDFEKIEGLI